VRAWVVAGLVVSLAPTVAAGRRAPKPAPPSGNATAPQVNLGPGKRCDDAGCEHWWPTRKGDSEPRAAPELPALTKAEVEEGLRAVEGKVRACGRISEPHVLVTLWIAPSGKVASAVATGRFDGTPLGFCVEKAVKQASFRPTRGQFLNYPFRLEQPGAAAKAPPARPPEPPVPTAPEKAPPPP
jgi:hypothetical protein